MTSRLAISVLCASTLLLGACGGGDDSVESGQEGSERQAVIDWMLAQDETPETAACFADELDDYTAADFEAFEAAATEADVPDGMADAVLAAAMVCVEG